jgi:hypothetical protein
MKISLGKWSEDSLEKLIRRASEIREPGKRILFLSDHFLDVPYGESTLIGAPGVPEEFVVNLGVVDCFTLLDYLEAMRRSRSYRDFLGNLATIRYRDGAVSFEGRNHFFTDWCRFQGPFVRDVTGSLAPSGARKTRKTLNMKDDGSFFVPGIKPVVREMSYIPREFIDYEVPGRLRGGDYVGIYAEAAGLDVTHVGIAVVGGGQVYLRHASSRKEARKVIDEPLKGYLRDKPGVLVLRPEEPGQGNAGRPANYSEEEQEEHR